MKNYRDLSLRYIKTQKRRTVLTIIGIILSVSLITGVQILYTSMLDYWERDAKENGNYHGYFYDVDYDKASRIKNYTGVESAYLTRKEGYVYARNASDGKVIFETQDVINSKEEHLQLEFMAMEEKSFNELKLKIEEGRFPKSSDEIVITKWLLGKLDGVKLGDRLDFWVSTRGEDGRSSQRRNYKIVGIIGNTSGVISNSMFTFMDEKKEGKYNVFINVNNPRNTYKMADNIGRDLGLEVHENMGTKYNFMGNEQLLYVYGGSADRESNLSTLLIIALITSIIIISTVAVIYNSFNISVIEKTSEYGLLRSVGATPGQIRRLVLKEGSLMAIIGIPLGILAGFLGIKGLYTAFEMLSLKVIEKLNLRIILRPQIFIVSILLSAITIYISAAIPAKRAALMAPVEALKRVDKNIKIKRAKRSRFIKSIFGAEGEIAYKNLRRNRKRFLVTVFSLALSVTLFIGFDSIIKQVFYVTKNNEMRSYSYSVIAADKEKHKRIFNDIKNMDNVERVYSKAVVDILVKPKADKIIRENIWWNPDKSGSVYLYNSSVNIMDEGYFNEVKDHILKGKVNIDALNEGGVMLLQRNIKQQNNSKKYVDYTNYQIGDDIEFVPRNSISDREGNFEKSYEKAEKSGAKVIGILNDIPVYAEYPREGLYFITTEKGAEMLKLRNTKPRMDIFKKPKTEGKEIVKYFEVAKEKGEITYFHDIDKAAEENRQFFITIGIVVYGFITLIILISSVNIFNTVSSNLFTRKREFGVIKSIGMSQASLRKMIYLEGFYYGLFAIIFGGAAGLGLSYLFHLTINLSMNIKWITSLNSFFIAALGVTAITALSTYLPLRKLNEENIIESIKKDE